MCAVHSAQVTSSEFTDAERRWLESNEPHTHLRAVDDIEGISQGRHSRVSILEYGRDDAAGRVIWKRMGVGKRLTRTEATTMWQQLESYKRELESCGWVIPHLLFSQVVEVSDSETQIFSYEQFIPGGDGDLMLSDPREPNFRKWHLVTEILRTLFHYPDECLRRDRIAGREVTCLPHGLDLKAANIVLEADTNQLYFVDLFGPKELNDDGSWVLYSPKLDSLPAEHLRAVCATREGCVLRFWRLARRLWEPDHDARTSLTPELLERLQSLGCATVELAFIEREIADGFPWLTNLYSERLV
jgi:hypothetical protein